MRALFLCLALALCGCESISRLGADDFEVGRGGYEVYEVDARACRMTANLPLDTDVRLLDATRYERNRVFNSLYARCMTERDHAPRPYLKNVLPSGDGL